ncbi:MAG: ferritin-like domain-containing protein [Anaerolineaceae bacterium]
MKKKNMKAFSGIVVIAILITGLLLATPFGTVSAYTEGNGGPGGRNGSGGGTGSGVTGTGVALTPLTDAEKEALSEAILEEYGALNLYNSLIAEFGNVFPFYRIARSEQQHVNALINQATKYGVTVPENPGMTSDVTFNSISDACAAGSTAEIADAALYDELKLVTTHSDILQVYTTLQNASLNSHLPTFQACE